MQLLDNLDYDTLLLKSKKEWRQKKTKETVKNTTNDNRRKEKGLPSNLEK